MGWEKLVAQPEPTVVSVVREFYANSIKHHDYRVFVRGKQVSFDRTTINQYFGVPNINNDEYFTAIDDCNFDWDKVVRHLCPKGTQWKRNHERLSKGFVHSQLHQDSKIWHHFITASLKPTTHLSDVSKDRAGLIWAIMTGKSIDIRFVIQQSIENGIRTFVPLLPHPMLITMLCKNAGVVWTANEEVLQPRRIMDNNFLMKMKDLDDESATEASFSRPQIPVQPTTQR
ncbi:hypothetical protein CRYUN_Cryun15aG0065300 [Craigia yunnanensis]